MKWPRLEIETRIVLYYILFGGLWIALSDRVLLLFLSDPRRMTVIQTYKGWAFVAASALLVFVLLRRHLEVQRQLAQDRQENEDRYRMLFNTSLDAILLTDPDGSIYAANPAACQIFGRTEAEICAAGRSGLMDMSDPRVINALDERSRTGNFMGELTLLRRDGSPFPGEVSTTLHKDARGRQRSSKIIRDISERKEAEMRIIRLNRLYLTLSQINQAILHAQDQHSLLNQISQIIIEYGQFSMAWIGLVDPADDTVKPVTYAGQEQGYLENINIQVKETVYGRGPTGTAIRENRIIICEDVAQDPKMDPWRDRALSRGFRSLAAVPIRAGKKAIGALSVYASASHVFLQEDEQLLTAVGENISYALDSMAAEDERQRMQDTVIAVHDRLNHVLNNINEAFITLDCEWRITYINNEAARINKKDPEAFLGRKHWEEWPASVGTQVEQQYRFAMEQRIPVQFEYHYIDEGQHNVWLSIRAYPFDDGLAVFYEDITERKKAEESLIHTEQALREVNEELTAAYDATIEGWSKAMDLRDRETEGHTQRVTQMLVDLARKLNLPEREIIHYRRGALLHDIGKMGIPDGILLKPGLLSEEERSIMRRHPRYAYEMLQSIGYVRQALDIPHYHHEKWDGSGYPYGLSGEQIPLAARLFAIIDVYDALTIDRPYRVAWSDMETLRYIKEQSGKHFDPTLVEVFIDYLQNKPMLEKTN